jgi:hypothetical protein
VSAAEAPWVRVAFPPIVPMPQAPVIPLPTSGRHIELALQLATRLRVDVGAVLFALGDMDATLADVPAGGV